MTSTKKNKDCVITQENKKEIFYNLINSGIAGGISFFSSIIATGKLELATFIIAFCVAGSVALIKFQNYWTLEKKEYSNKILNFL